MKKCNLCKSKMPDELFVPAYLNGQMTKDLCPICTMVRINQLHGLPPDTLPRGEIAGDLIEEAWQYYKPKGQNIYDVKPN